MEKGGAMLLRFADASAERHSRSIAKAVSWRATGSLDTFCVSWFVTGNAVFAGSIAVTEIVTKIVLYYLHERVWGRIKWGRGAAEPSAPAGAWPARAKGL
jgi:uncharacterized membrane protein